MSLDPSHSEVLFRQSVKKFFVDNLYTVDGVYLDFGKIYKEPLGIDSWIRFHFNGISVRGTMFIGRVGSYMFTRKDKEGMALAALRDKLYNYLVDLSMPDGLRRIPLYDETWSNIGGMVVTTGNESNEEYADDDTLYKFINIYFRYAVK